MENQNGRLRSCELSWHRHSVGRGTPTGDWCGHRRHPSGRGGSAGPAPGESGLKSGVINCTEDCTCTNCDLRIPVHFKHGKLIGNGSFGSVYDHDAAAKVIKIQVVTKQIKNLLYWEYSILSTHLCNKIYPVIYLDNTNKVKQYHVGLIMPKFKLITIYDRKKMIELFEMIKYIHSKKIVHCDIALHNIMENPETTYNGIVNARVSRMHLKKVLPLIKELNK